ncbi:transporter substrate-binding domain-containing protein [Inquilinus sp. CAU 1745]|uniref:transporter substrate-binding domain-containing protein n=1 Tax=Inquilinus sp. CAU 1745 TaxID=3140369 RepID=UPI00325B1AFD
MKQLKFGMAVAAVALAASTVPGAAEAQETLANIESRGKIVVGVKADYKPFGFIDPSGEIVGMEPDLARDIAERLGVEIEFVPVIASNRMEFVQQGRIDLMIATMTDTEERAAVVGIPDPSYYSSGTNVLARKSVGLEEWDDLDGLPVCGIQGAFYNRRTAEEFGAEIVAFTGTSEALNALQSGRCAAFVYDDALIVSTLADTATWGDYEMPLETIDDSPWGMGVLLGDEEMMQFISEVTIDWHRDGTILELEEKWGIQPSPFAQAMHEEYGE